MLYQFCIYGSEPCFNYLQTRFRRRTFINNIPFFNATENDELWRLEGFCVRRLPDRIVETGQWRKTRQPQALDQTNGELIFTDKFPSHSLQTIHRPVSCSATKFETRSKLEARVRVCGESSAELCLVHLTSTFRSEQTKGKENPFTCGAIYMSYETVS